MTLREQASHFHHLRGIGVDGALITRRPCVTDQCSPDMSTSFVIAAPLVPPGCRSSLDA